jgi:hypothetical protein
MVRICAPVPLLERKRRLRAILSQSASRLVYLDHVERHGVALFDAIRDDDLEGIVAKWKHGHYYTDGQTTSWFKIRNAAYSQVEGRAKLFTPRRMLGSRSRAPRPVLAPELAQHRRPMS